MVRHPLLRAAVPVIGLPLLLGACGSSAKTSASDNPVVAPTTAGESTAPETTAAPTTAAATSAAPSASTSPSAAGPPRCSSAQLKATKGSGQGAAGHIFLNVILTNTGSSACHLYGYPGMALLDASKDPLTTHVHFGGGMLPATAKQNVVLAAGGEASYTLEYSDVPTGNETEAEGCPPASFEQVTPPDETASILLTAQMAPCDGNIYVSPVVSGTNGVD